MTAVHSLVQVGLPQRALGAYGYSGVFNDVPALSSLRIKTVTAMALGGLALGSCSVDRGPATYAYMRARVEIFKNLADEISREPPLKFPDRPVMPARATPEQHRLYNRQMQAYPAQVETYLDLQIQHLRRISGDFDLAQRKLGQLSASGVDKVAIRLVLGEEKLLGDGRISLLELAELIGQSKAAYIHDMNPDIIGGLIAIGAPAVTGYMKGGWPGAIGGVLQGVGQLDAKTSAQRQRMTDQATRFHDTAVALNRDEIAIRTERSQITTILSGMHTSFDWSFLEK